MLPDSCPSNPVSIFITGDYDAARQICRDFCDEVGFCVTVTPTSSINTGGEEVGVIVGPFNYPRFPASQVEIADTALRLAGRLCENLEQESYSIQYPDTTVFHSWRESYAPTRVNPTVAGVDATGEVE